MLQRMITTSRALALCTVALLLVGCASRASQQAEMVRQQEAARQAAIAACEKSPTWTEGVTCQNKITEAYIRDTAPEYLDIVQLNNAYRLKYAQMVDAKQISPEDARLGMAKVVVEMRAQLDARVNAQRAIEAQESAARAQQRAASAASLQSTAILWNALAPRPAPARTPITCTTQGVFTNCF